MEHYEFKHRRNFCLLGFYSLNYGKNVFSPFYSTTSFPFYLVLSLQLILSEKVPWLSLQVVLPYQAMSLLHSRQRV